MFISWVAFPAAVLLTSFGLGMLVDRASARSVPMVLMMPLGAAALVSLTQVMTAWSVVAPLTPWVVVVATALGLVLGRSRIRQLREISWAAAAATVVFLIAAMPVVATGTASFAGYTVLGDTAVHFAGAEELVDRGRDAGDLPASNYAVTFRTYYVDNAYPAGGATAFGTVARLVGADVAWVFQSFLAVLLGLLALAIAALVEPVLRSQRRTALVAVVAAQSAVLVAFAMQGGLKEVAVTLMLATLAALIPSASAADAPSRAGIPLAVAAAAAVGVLGPSAVVWIAPLLAGWLVIARTAGRSVRSLAHVAALVALLTVALSAQTLVLLETATSVATSVASTGEVGNLLRPLDVEQAIGVWLTGDFRVAPTGISMAATRLVEVAVVAAAVVGVTWCVARRAWVPLLYVATLVAGGMFVMLRGSVWADAKALAIVSPAILTIAMLGIAGHLERPRILAGAAAAIVIVGVVGSNVLIYRSASVAPSDRLNELSEIGEEFAGHGPLLFTEFDEFAPYFLRDAQPEAGALLVSSSSQVSETPHGAAADLDQMSPVDLERFRVIVTRRGPIGSRPPSIYRLRTRTEHYDVWERRGGSRVVARTPLGSPRAPAAPISCAEARRLAGQARRGGGRLIVAEVPARLVVNPASEDMPAGWRRDPEDPTLTLPSGGGRAQAQLDATAGGRYDVWLEGSTGRATRVIVDGTTVGTLRNRLAGRRVAERVGSVDLKPGVHSVAVERPTTAPVPGAGGLFRPLGPVYFVPAEGATQVRSVDPARWRELCGRSFDWVEVVA